ncbi:MAG: DUF3187 family protein, partial [Acidiferrobacterales bacterium]|nr:DUF3187 family protein [Acidiferrobacterales bacterium]
VPSITFSDDLSAALAEAREAGKPVAVVFLAVWCPNCKRFETTTLMAPAVQALGHEFHWVRIDIDHQAVIARNYDINAIPQLLLLDSQGRVWSRIIGVSSSDALRADLDEFLEMLHAHRETPPARAVVKGVDNPQSPLIWRPRGFRAKSICFSHVGYGPLRIRSQSPFQALRLTLVPRTPSTLARKEKEVRAAGTWVNIWSPGSDHFMDYETLQLGASVAYGISDTWQVEVELESASRFGGEMDSLIQQFHDAFGIDQNGRDEVPKGDYRFDLTAPDGSMVSGESGVFSRGLVVTVQNNVTCGTEKLPAFAYALTWRYELEAVDLEGGSPSDFGVSLALSRRFGNLYGYVTLGFAKFGRDSFRGIPLRDTQTSLLAAVEWRHWPKTSLILQYLATEGAVDDFGDFSDTSNEIVFGWKKEVHRGTVLEAGIIENVVTFGNSPDFGLHFGLTHRF